MYLTDYVTTFGQAMRKKYGYAVHKLALDAAFTCPNRDGSKGRGGCTFCNNVSFSPHGRKPKTIPEQIAAGQVVMGKRKPVKNFLAYFQAYTNTYEQVAVLKKLYDQALAQPGIIGLSVGTRPDCVPDEVLDLLASYQEQGYEVWLELGLQSSFDSTLDKVNRGHDYSCFLDAVKSAHKRDLSVCSHLIIGLPGETARHYKTSLNRVLETGVEGLKFHPLHVVKGTLLANQWRRGEYQALHFNDYVQIAADLIELTPPEIIFHRLTGTASSNILLTPAWCSGKWQVLNAITQELRSRGSYQGSKLTGKDKCAL